MNSHLHFNKQIQLAFIYGSISKGTEVKTSDIDLMFVGKGLVYGDVMDLLLSLETSLQRPINPTMYTPAKFRQSLNQGSSFLTRLMDQPVIMIKGIIDDFREAVKN